MKISPRKKLVVLAFPFLISFVRGACYYSNGESFCDTHTIVTVDEETGESTAVMGPAPTPSPISLCLAATETLMESVHSFYDASGSTITILDPATNPLPTKTIIDDFSSNSANNDYYKYMCEEAGGKYVELTYSATCQSDNNEDTDVDIVVYDQPRCYDQTECTLQDDDISEAEALFINGTLSLTQERADLEEGADWTCAGNLFGSTDPPSACMWQTKKTKDIALIEQENKQTASAKTSKKKFLGFIQTSTVIVEFTPDNLATFETACTGIGGTANLGSKDVGVTCSQASGKTRPFIVSYFSACLGSHCSPLEILEASGDSLMNVLLELDELEGTWTCSQSSAAAIGALTTLLVTVGASLTMLWI
jgi:hypothetical protein